MKLSPAERAARRESFGRMTTGEKAEYILDYYKLPIVLGLLAALLLGTALYRALTRKEVLLYVGLVNTAVGTELEDRLTEGYLTSREADKRSQIYVYSGLYLSDDPAPENHEYAYASRLKTLAAINAKQLDLVLMNREAYDLFSSSGYLLPLPEVAPEIALPMLTDNTVILEDNDLQVRLGEAQEYRAETETQTNALLADQLPVFRQAGFSGSVYLGVIANSPRLSQITQYLEYLCG